jgi:hypothetical protein
MALGSTQPVAEMSTRNLSAGKKWPTRKADNRTIICEPIVQKMWEPRRLTTLRPSTACDRDSFTFTCLLRQCLFNGLQLAVLTIRVLAVHLQVKQAVESKQPTNTLYALPPTVFCSGIALNINCSSLTIRIQQG